MKVGRGRHLRVWFAAAPPGGPRSNPVGYYRAGSGPGTVERESGKSRWRAGQARIFFWRLLWRATPPRLGEWKKRRALPRPTQVRDQHSVGYAFWSSQQPRDRMWRRTLPSHDAAPRSLPPEQPLDVGELQFNVSRAAMVALAGVWHFFHLAQQRVHLLGLEAASGAHRAVAGHGGGHVHEAAFERQRLVPFCHVLGEVAQQQARVDLTQQ